MRPVREVAAVGLRSFLEKPGIVVGPLDKPVVIGDDIDVRARVLASRSDVALAGGRLELHLVRSAPPSGPCTAPPPC